MNQCKCCAKYEWTTAHRAIDFFVDGGLKLRFGSSAITGGNVMSKGGSGGGGKGFGSDPILSFTTGERRIESRLSSSPQRLSFRRLSSGTGRSRMLASRLASRRRELGLSQQAVPSTSAWSSEQGSCGRPSGERLRAS